MVGDDDAPDSVDELAPWTVKRTYLPVLSAVGKPFRADASWEDGFFYAARMVIGAVIGREAKPERFPMPGIEGVAGVFLFRHYLELALKNILFHSRWLVDTQINAEWDEIKALKKTHKLLALWDAIERERVGKISDETWKSHDIDFVRACVGEFDNADPTGDMFRYHREEFAITRDAPAPFELRIDLPLILAQMDHIRDVLWSLDSMLVNQHGFNEEWAEIRASY